MVSYTLPSLILQLKQQDKKPKTLCETALKQHEVLELKWSVWQLQQSI